VAHRQVVHWEIAAKDAKKAQEFYGKLFEWTIDANNPMNYGLVRSGGGQGGIDGGIFAVQNGQPSYVTFYVEVDDLQSYLAKAESLGGKTVIPPMPVPNVGSIAMFSDPEGNFIGLFKSL
jgi:predicted enzyme related to lactoylglutathione lyase